MFVEEVEEGVFVEEDGVVVEGVADGA